MSRHDPEGLVTFEAGGKKYTMLFGFRAMKAVEMRYDLPFFEALQRAMPSLSVEDANDPAKVAAAGASIRISDVGTLFGAALLKHHPKLTDDAIEDLIDEIGLAKAGEYLGKSVSAALVEGGDDAPENPPVLNGKTG